MNESFEEFKNMEREWKKCIVLNTNVEAIEALDRSVFCRIVSTEPTLTERKEMLSVDEIPSLHQLTML